MEIPATGVPIRLTAEQVREQAPQRWFNTTELCQILANPEILKILLISQRQERPTNGAFFAIAVKKRREFRKDGHVWARKKDGKTIQESHEDLKVGGEVMFNCLYAYGERENNFQRRIYQPIKKEHGDIVLFHYREDKSQENRKICRRGIKRIEANPQSIQEAGKVIRTLAVTGFSSDIVDHSSNQLSLLPQTANTSNLNSQENFQRRRHRLIKKEHDVDRVLSHCRKDKENSRKKIAKVTPQPSQETNKVIPTLAVTGSSSVIVDHSSNQLSLPPRTANTDNLNIQKNVESAGCSQLHLAPKTADTGNQNSIQAIAQPSGSSLGIFNHENYQLPVPPNTTGSGTQSNIQGNAESAGDVMLHYDSELKNQSFPQETKNDFFTNLSYPAEPGSPSDLPGLMKYMESTSQEKRR